MSKAYIPKNLFTRALLILVLPTLFIQIITAYIFFNRHWDNVARHMSNYLAGEIAFLVNRLDADVVSNRQLLIKEFRKTTGINAFFEPKESFVSQEASDDFIKFQNLLASKIDNKFTVKRINDADDIEIHILFTDESLKLVTSIKRLESRTTTIFIAWTMGASLLFLLVAILFLRNQIKPITRLALAADNFGRGLDTPNFRPHGAMEVRKAARAFIVMRERIRRQLKTRTDMLSGISHDLRTPLTRMKLQLAMLPKEVVNRSDMREVIFELNDDVQQMQHMIQEYLDFVSYEGKEEVLSLDLGQFLEDIINDYRRMKQEVNFENRSENVINIELRISPCRRMLHNLIDNALRYGKSCKVGLRKSGSYAEITVDDEGSGIPKEKRDEVFRPFKRLEPSRNSKTGGVGLGLTIARDIVLTHGGSIELLDSPLGGLRVLIRLPL
ncbi:MAG: ATP-binding protein [Rickettsiales bacterium]